MHRRRAKGGRRILATGVAVTAAVALAATHAAAGTAQKTTRPPNLSPKQQKTFYSEGGHPKVAKPTGGTQSRKAAKTKYLGTYVGPPKNGASDCGYVAIGPGMEQAESFGLRSVRCRTARKLATGARGHSASGHRNYRAIGFDCTGSVSGRKALLRYRCTSGDRTVTFVVS